MTFNYDLSVTGPEQRALGRAVVRHIQWLEGEAEKINDNLPPMHCVECGQVDPKFQQAAQKLSALSREKRACDSLLTKVQSRHRTGHFTSDADEFKLNL